MVELGIVVEEMGRALVCAPYFASAVLAATAIMNAATEAQKDALLPPHRARRERRDPGVQRAERALGRGRRRDDGDRSRRRLPPRRGEELRARRRAPPTSSWSSPARRIDRRGGPLVLHRARRCGRPHAPDAEGARSHPQARAARVPSGRGRAAGRARRRRRAVRQDADQAAVALASEMVGGAEQAARVRPRLRQPAHAVRPPDRLVPVDEAQAGRHAARGRARQVGRLLRRARPPPKTPPTLPRSRRWPRPPPPKPTCRPPIHTIQIHGGIGFTWDNDTHLWFKRAKSSRGLPGRPDLASRAADAGMERVMTTMTDPTEDVRPRRGPRLARGELEPRSRPRRMAQQADRRRLGRADLAEGLARPRPAAGARRRRRPGDPPHRRGGRGPRRRAHAWPPPTLLAHGTDEQKQAFLRPQPHRRGQPGASCSASRAPAPTSPAP